MNKEKFDKVSEVGSNLVNDTLGVVRMNSISLISEHGAAAGLAYIMAVYTGIQHIAERSLEVVINNEMGDSNHDCENCTPQVKAACEAIFKNAEYTV